MFKYTVWLFFFVHTAFVCLFVCLNECRCNYAVLGYSCEMEYKSAWISRCGSVSSSVASASCVCMNKGKVYDIYCMFKIHNVNLSIGAIIFKLSESHRKLLNWLRHCFRNWSSIHPLYPLYKKFRILKGKDKKKEYQYLLTTNWNHERFSPILFRQVVICDEIFYSFPHPQIDRVQDALSSGDKMSWWTGDKKKKRPANYFLTYWIAFVGPSEVSGVDGDVTGNDSARSRAVTQTRILEIEWLVWPAIACNLHLH